MEGVNGIYFFIFFIVFLILPSPAYDFNASRGSTFLILGGESSRVSGSQGNIHFIIFSQVFHLFLLPVTSTLVEGFICLFSFSPSSSSGKEHREEFGKLRNVEIHDGLLLVMTEKSYSLIYSAEAIIEVSIGTALIRYYYYYCDYFQSQINGERGQYFLLPLNSSFRCYFLSFLFFFGSCKCFELVKEIYIMR